MRAEIHSYPPTPASGRTAPVAPRRLAGRAVAWPTAAVRLALPALALLAVALRWAGRAGSPYNWDSVHYLLAQERYDLTLHQPHAPGSYYYVLLARLLGAATGEPHAALLLLSALSGAGLVLVLFVLGRELGGARAGWIAAVTAATAPLFWFYGSVALNYAPAGCLAALTALGCLRLWRGGQPALPAALLAGGALGLLGGFRPTDSAFLAPALGAALAAAACRGERRAAAAGLALAAALSAGWLAANVWHAGGPAGFLSGLRALETVLGRTSVFLAGWPAWSDALLTHRRSLESVLGVLWLPLLLLPLARAAHLTLRGGKRLPAASGGASSGLPLLPLALLLVLPAALFYQLGHFNSPGYALTYAGLVAALAAAAVAGPARTGAGQKPPRLTVLLPAVALGNSFLFTAGWPNRLLGEPETPGQRALSLLEIRDHDRYYRELAAFVDRRHRPGEARLLASWTATDGLRVVQALLPRHAADVAQALGAVPHLPPELARLHFLRLTTPGRVAAEGRPTYAVARTREDRVYHEALFPGRLEPLPLGTGHTVLRVRPASGREDESGSFRLLPHRRGYRY